MRHRSDGGDRPRRALASWPALFLVEIEATAAEFSLSAALRKPLDWSRLAKRRITRIEMVPLWNRLMPLVAALLLALPGAGGGAAYLFCHGMGRVVDKCCCPSTPTSASTHETCGAKVQAPDCCERVRLASGTAAAASREKAAGIDGSVPAVPPPSPIIVLRSDRFERDVVPEPVEARAPPPRGPPLFLANCSFLS